jgi:acetyltransferase-like isoleucine patch superfamily enzyme
MSEHTLATILGDISGVLRRVPSWLWRWEAQFKGVRFEGRSEFLGRPLISLVKGGRMVFGDGVRIYSSVRANPLACFQPSALRVLAPEAQLILGRNVGMSATAICAGLSIEIGEGTIMGAGAMIIDNDFHHPSGQWEWTNDSRSKARPIQIGRGVFIGARAIVLKGVTIGDRAVIGAGALVSRDVPAYHLAVGNPARVFPPKGGTPVPQAKVP